MPMLQLLYACMCLSVCLSVCLSACMSTMEVDAPVNTMHVTMVNTSQILLCARPCSKFILANLLATVLHHIND